MIKNIVIGVSTILSLYGCVSSTSLRNQAQIKSISDTDFKKYLDEDIQAKSKINIPQPQILDETWVDTQKANCKIFASSQFKKEDPTVKFYWDGECKDGYAIGLGREFSIGKQTYVEAIGEYEGGKKLPEYFYNFNKVKKIFVIGYLPNNPENTLLFQGTLDNNNMFKKSIIFYDFKQKDMYEKMSYDDVGMQGIGYTSSGGLNVIEKTFTADPMLQKQMLVQIQNNKLYSFEAFKDGRKLFVDMTSGSPVLAIPSENLKEFLTKKLSLIDSKVTNQNDLDLQRSLKADKKVNTYVNLTCTSTNYIKEVGKDNYFAICSPYKSLGIFKSQIQQGKEFANQQAQKRSEEVEQYLDQQKTNIQQAQQMRIEQQKRSQEGWTALLNALTEVSNGVADGYKKQADLYRSFGNSMPSSTAPILNKQKSTFNCINIGVSTTCKEQ
ncbi:hypothetical protein KWF73_15545 [Acinetobacter pittii]|uniref:hypothetical protein n=1 Tax=Acinetobacter pittii TaxID=48296 RepID=UPI00355BAE62